MAADLAETQKFCAQTLRKAGKLCGVALIRDSASREKVQELAEAIEGSDGPTEQKAAAARSYEVVAPAEERAGAPESHCGVIKVCPKTKHINIFRYESIYFFLAAVRHSIAQN